MKQEAEMNTSTNNRIALGETVITAAARESLHTQDVLSALWRHGNEPWGASFDPELSGKEDRRLVSNHVSSRGVGFKVATDTERGVTIVFLSDEKDHSSSTSIESWLCTPLCPGCGN